MPATPWLPKPLPWMSPDYTDDVVMAIRAFEAGNANEGQQRTVWRYLMYVTRASEEFADLSFRPEDKGGERATIFAEGARFVGLMLRKLLRAECTPKTQSPQSNQPIQKRMRARRAGKVI